MIKTESFSLALRSLVLSDRNSLFGFFFQVLLQLDPFLNELTSMFEKSKDKGSVWVTLKRCKFGSLVYFSYLLGGNFI